MAGSFTTWPATVVMGTVFKSLYTFEQNSSQVCFISTRLIVPPYYTGYAKHSNESWKVPECGQFYEQQAYFPNLFYYSLQSGMYWLQLVDKYAANWSVLLIAIAECILISWVYGANRFLRDIQDMIGQKSRIWTFFWTWMWKVITPAALLVRVCENFRYHHYIYIYTYIHTHTHTHKF